MTRTAYIAGETEGLAKQQVKRKFDVVSSELTGMGYRVVKPAGVTDDATAWDIAVRNDIKKMLECDEVHMLPDWQESRGAQLERDIALRLGMQVVYH